MDSVALFPSKLKDEQKGGNYEWNAYSLQAKSPAIDTRITKEILIEAWATLSLGKRWENMHKIRTLEQTKRVGQEQRDF